MVYRVQCSRRSWSGLREKDDARQSDPKAGVIFNYSFFYISLCAEISSDPDEG